ncbi:MAG: serine protease [Planctomycetota bacterium]
MSDSLDDLLEQLREASRTLDADVAEALAQTLVRRLRDEVERNPVNFTVALERAVDAMDRTRATEVCALLVHHVRQRSEPYPLDHAKKVLGLLRRKRYFDLATRVAEAVIQTGQDAPRIRREYAQALLDQGLLIAGESVLMGLERDLAEGDDDEELREARGLLGRARKQMYVDAVKAGDPSAATRSSLRSAIRSYWSVYEADDSALWHGINAVALLARTRLDILQVEDSSPDPRSVAEAILEKIRAMESPEAWDLATAAEASLALGDSAGALAWTVKYTNSEGADAFEFGSTLRQFEEVWKLDDAKAEHAKILSVLRSALLEKEGGHVDLGAAATSLSAAREIESDEEFERVLGKDRYRSFRWYRTGLDRASAVAKIADRNGNGHGTGFLLRTSELGLAIGTEWVLVTNAHVLSNDATEQRGSPPALPPDEVRVLFEASDRPADEFEVAKILFSSPRSELDCTVAVLRDCVEPNHPIPIARRLPLVDRNQRVYVVGHPKGGGLSFSINDNLLLDHEEPKVHYRAPTEGGSSGSPVFNQDWDLIALHHAGGMEMPRLNGKAGRYPANAGLAIQSILAALRAELG